MSTRHRLTNLTPPVLPQAIHEAIEEEALVLDRLYGRIPPGSHMSDCVEALERIASLACVQQPLADIERWLLATHMTDAQILSGIRSVLWNKGQHLEGK